MHPQRLKKNAQRPLSSTFTRCTSGLSTSYPKTRIRGSRLLNPARILALVELSRRLHQAYRFAYDKQAADRLLPQNPGGGGGQQNPRGNTGPRAQFDLNKFNDCLQHYFGVTLGPSDGRSRTLSFTRSGGSFVGFRGNQPLTVTTDTITRTSSQLGRQLQGVRANPTGVDQSGATFLANPSPNFIASDVASDRRNTSIGLFGLFIHELGNSLGVQVGLSDPFGGYGVQNSARGISDPDVGAAFESCVFGGLVGLRSGRVGSRREFY